MFSTKSQLKKRTPENGTDRENFLSLLVDEYLNSNSFDAKCQVLANLANFAYDPINYRFIRDVGVLDIFMYVLKNESNNKLLSFACAGVCNLCIDPLNVTYILQHLELKYIRNLLHSEDSEILANTITTLIYLFSEQTRSEINIPEVLQVIHRLKDSEDKIISNLAKVFIKDVCNEE
ncbi:armadillo repeat-containing protein 7 [Plodia interpunctella]|uniref:armadillo repeat-containing protein 7 n=1 Tax=Plodia interpunctella TaxID=58824 RepID=UPI0023683DE2|nr:armadillo repeat-containing protein 7 [Plodia interpunctella]